MEAVLPSMTTTRPLPTTGEEIWKYSRIAELDVDAYAPAPRGDDATLPAALAAIRDAVPGADVVFVRNGHVVASDLDVAGDVAPPEAVDAFGDLHAAHSTPTVVKAGDKPVLVLHWTEGDGVATYPHLVLDVAEDRDLVVYEHSASSDDAVALTVPVTDIRVGAASRVHYLHGQVLGCHTWQIGRQRSTVERDASLTTGAVALGGDYARLRIESSLVGRGASGTMLAAYFGEQRQMHDIRTLQDHVAPATQSDLLFKGAVEGLSQSIYTGLIHIGKDASGVNAFQTNRNIKLSEGAWAHSDPNLEIENNDVRCSHASTIGPVDEDQRFYLESRGVPPQVAERLIVMGFFDDVLARLPLPGAVALLRDEIERKLSRREAEVGS
jgi:Fe-S cluster assembly protein SufD